MKTIAIKKTIAVFMLVASAGLTAFGQSAVLPNSQGGDKPENLDRSTIPGPVSENYVREYPKTTYETWYYYPSSSYDESAEWYVYVPSVIAETEPAFYVVEFTNQDEVPYKVVYSKDGKRVTTYRGNNVLPKAVTDAIKKSPYKDWALTKDKEEMWKDSDNKKVYKVVMEKGSKKHVLYYQEDGKLLKDKDKS